LGSAQPFSGRSRATPRAQARLEAEGLAFVPPKIG
jgi:hypothetical protein